MPKAKQPKGFMIPEGTTITPIKVFADTITMVVSVTGHKPYTVAVPIGKSYHLPTNSTAHAKIVPREQDPVV
jgi:hypothetical protein